jgi:hypothetical protein
LEENYLIKKLGPFSGNLFKVVRKKKMKMGRKNKLVLLNIWKKLIKEMLR